MPLESQTTNLPALGRFKPGPVSTGGGPVGLEISIFTTLAGEPIRFTMNEDFGNIVSSASMTLLNAKIDEITEIQDTAITAMIITEDDMAQWNTLTQGASVEPNQLADVTVVRGTWSSSTDPETGIVSYTSDDGEVLLTHWRVVDFVAYVDEKDIPYCDVNLESLSQIAVDSKVIPVEMGYQDTAFILMDVFYYIDVQAAMEKWSDDDGAEFLALSEGNNLCLIGTPDVWTNIFFEKIAADGFNFLGSISGIEHIPAYKVYNYGESCWQCIDDVLSFNGLAARFKRDGSLVQWSVDDEGYGETVSIGTYGQGLKLSYSKSGVFNQCEVSGTLGKIDDTTGRFIPYTMENASVTVVSSYANNILNGQTVAQKVVVNPDYLLENHVQLFNWGAKEIGKSCMSARGVSVSSDSIPMSTEVGMKISGSSSLAGSVTMLVTSFSLSADAQQNTLDISITGRAEAISGSEDSWS